MSSVDSDPAPRWPAVTYEELPWESRLEHGSASRNQVRAHRGPYSAAIPASIREARYALQSEVAAAVDDAANEIVRYDEQAGAVVAPFIRLLLRSESAASSQIENLTASARAVAQAELLGASRGSNAAQIVANTSAMTAAIDLAGNLSADSIRSMHAALMSAHDASSAGMWRSEQVWIGGSSLGPHRADFVPPRHTRVSALIDDLVAFMAREDIPVLAQAAIAHAQFETIHPFTDGNGRTGRALIHALLRGKGLIRHMTVPLSAGLLVDVEAYFKALTAYRAGDADAIVVQLAEAAFAGIRNGRTLVTELNDIRRSWQERVHARRGSNTWRVAELLFEYPVVNAHLIASKLGISAANVYRPLEPLLDAEVLTESTNRSRGRIWRSDEVLGALDAFASRAGRRQR